MSDPAGLLYQILLGVAPIAGLFAVFAWLEHCFPAQTGKPLKGWIFNIKLALLYLAVPTLLAGPIAFLIALARRHNGGGMLNLASSEGAGIATTLLQAIVFLVIFDFFYYWWHRAQHALPALWAIHKLHHMDESVGVSTQMRCHWLEEIGRIPFIFLPMALLFNLPLHAGVVAIALTVWGAFIHANLRLGFGRASALIAGPQVHRIHHSRLPQHYDRNFAAFFPIFDVMFRTYHHPLPDEFPPTGVVDEPEINSVLQAFLLPFRDWARAVRRGRTGGDMRPDPPAGLNFPAREP